MPLPHERFTLETPLDAAEVVQRLRDATAPAPGGRLFRGSVDHDEFRLRRAIRYRNSFLPVLHGRIEATATGTRLRVSMRLDSWVVAFMGVWFGVLTVVLVAAVAIVVGEGEFTPLVFAPLLLFAFGYALTVGAFKLEEGRGRELLEAVLRARSVAEVEPPRYWPEARLKIRWSDLRGVGVLGFVWAGCYGVGAALGLYDWIVRRAGCTNAEDGDPRYICPGDARVFSVWGLLAALVTTGAVGLYAIRVRRPRLLVPIVLVQVLAIVALAWIAQDPAFHVRRR
jgi:hypothetical protein